MNYFSRLRFYTAAISAWLMNLNMFGLSFRKICAPGFNCHGCPWATMACPIGVFAYSSAIQQIPLLAISTVLAIALFTGRLVCGFVCPFGLLQDLLAKFPTRKLAIPRFLRYGKYILLFLLVVLLPYLFGFEVSGYLNLPKPEIAKNESGNVEVKTFLQNISQKAVHSPELDLVYVAKDGGEKIFEKRILFDAVTVPSGETFQPAPIELPNMLAEADLLVSSPQSHPVQTPRYRAYFCVHCPKGTLTASLPGKLSSGQTDGIYSSGFFSMRYLILAGFILSALFVSRIFCRIACPLGAIYALFAKISVFGKLGIDASKCINCGKCDKLCPMGLDVRHEIGSGECISCGDCAKVCPVKCINRCRA